MHARVKLDVVIEMDSSVAMNTRQDPEHPMYRRKVINTAISMVYAYFDDAHMTLDGWTAKVIEADGELVDLRRS